MFAWHEQKVRCYWCIECVMIWCAMHHDTITIAHPSAIELTWLCTDGDMDWIYGTVSWWLWMNRQYVVNGVCLNFNDALFITPSRLHTRLLFNHNGNDVLFCADVDVDWIYGTVSCWLWTNRKYVGISVCWNCNVSWYTMKPSQSQLHWEWPTPLSVMRWCRRWLNIWNGDMFASDEQAVRWY